MSVDPSVPLAVLTGLGCTGVYLIARGTGGGRLILVLIAAILGAWAGAWLGQRAGMRFLAIGDFALIPAVAVGAFGIVFVAIIATLGPAEREPRL